MNWFDDNNDSKRTLGIRDKQILYRNANKKCQNPTCNKKIDFDEMQVGHKTAWSKGGRTTLKNCFCLCYRCNKLQGTDSWATFLNKQGIKDEKTNLKEKLDFLNISQLKFLAEKNHVKVKGKVEEDFFNTTRKAPTKKQYISKLAGIVSEKEVVAILNKKATTTKKKATTAVKKKAAATAVKKKAAATAVKKKAAATAAKKKAAATAVKKKAAATAAKKKAATAAKKKAATAAKKKA